MLFEPLNNYGNKILTNFQLLVVDCGSSRNWFCSCSSLLPLRISFSNEEHIVEHFLALLGISYLAFLMYLNRHCPRNFVWFANHNIAFGSFGLLSSFWLQQHFLALVSIACHCLALLGIALALALLVSVEVIYLIHRQIVVILLQWHVKSNFQFIGF